MDADEFAKRCLQRLQPEEEQEADSFELWLAFVNECLPWFERRADDLRATITAYRSRLAVGKEYPGVLDSMRQSLPRYEMAVALWEAFRASDVDTLVSLLDSDLGREEWGRLEAAMPVSGAAELQLPAAQRWLNWQIDTMFKQHPDWERFDSN